MISQEYLQLLGKLTPKFGSSKSIHDEWLNLILVWNDDHVLRVQQSLQRLAEIGLGILVTHYDHGEITIINNMIELHKNKSAGYSGYNEDAWANFRTCEAFGISAVNGCITRLADKYTRYTTLLENPELEKVNEKIEDTLMDLVSYSCILICLLGE